MQSRNALLMPEGRIKAMSGMSMARAIHIPRGQVLYRFYDSRRAPSAVQGADGGWWLEFEHFQAIKHFAARNGYTLSYAVRLFAAVLYEWSEVNAYVACSTQVDLSAWKGRGKQVQSTGKDVRDLPTMTPMQSLLEIYQLFIPGLGGPNSLSAQALRVERHAAIA